MDFADQLLQELTQSNEWPLKRERHARRTIHDRRAFRFNDRVKLKQLADWHRHTVDNIMERDYVVDPLPKLIERAFADFLYGEDPVFTSPDAQDDLDEFVEENRLPAQLHRAQRLLVGEGEGWWKLHADRTVAPVAMLEWYTRLAVTPLFYGRRVLACAFVTDVCVEQAASNPDDPIPAKVWRHAEIHTDQRVLNRLFLGTHDTLGVIMDLGLRVETAELQEEWRHGLPMLAGRIINDLEDDPTLGVADTDQVRDELLALNEAMTISVENARLTGQDRIFTAGRFTRPDGSFDPSMQVFQVEGDGGTLGEGDGKPPIVAVEKHYDAEPLWMHIQKTTSVILSRVGIVPRFIGQDEHTSGRVNESGVAIRLKFLPTTNAARGKAREWDADLPRILDLALRVGNLAVEKGGFGRPYAPVNDAMPVVERGEPLPADEQQTVADNAAAVTAEIRSRRTAVIEQHPDWTPEQIDEELRLITEDISGSLPTLPALPGEPTPA